MTAISRVVGNAISELVNEQIANALENVATPIFEKYQKAEDGTVEQTLYSDLYDAITTVVNELRDEETDEEEDDDEDGSDI